MKPVLLNAGRLDSSWAQRKLYGQQTSRQDSGGSDGPPCPNCGNSQSTITDKRGVRRRRVCSVCTFRYTTYELVAPEYITDYQI